MRALVWQRCSTLSPSLKFSETASSNHSIRFGRNRSRLAFLILIKAHTCFQIFDTKFRPWSEWSTEGTPLRAMTFSISACGSFFIKYPHNLEFVEVVRMSLVSLKIVISKIITLPISNTYFKHTSEEMAPKFQYVFSPMVFLIFAVLTFLLF